MVSATTIYCFEHQEKMYALMQAKKDYAFVSLLLPNGLGCDEYLYPSGTAEEAIQKAKDAGRTITEFTIEEGKNNVEEG